MEPRTIFETDRLVVRDWHQDDCDRIVAIDTHRQVSDQIAPDPAGATAKRAAATERIMSWIEFNKGPLYGVWAAEEFRTGVVVGTVLLRPLPPGGGKGEVEVGWQLHPDSWGRGLATEAARGALAHGFEAGLPEIYALIRPDDESSLAVCARLGMHPLGRTDRWYGQELESFVI